MELIHYLSALMDTNLAFKNHATNVYKKLMISLQGIKLIRVCLTKKNAETLVFKLVASHLDNANTILAGLPENTTKSNKEYKTWPQIWTRVTRRVTAILRNSKHYTGCL